MTQGEYYVNDYGKQIEALGESLRFRAKERFGQAAGESIEQWLSRADKALYEAKRAGRNRCAIAS